MEHILWVVLVAWLGVTTQGAPTIEYKVHSVHVQAKECHGLAESMSKEAQSNQRVDVQCIPFPHKTIW
jgi:hypothetical protein